MKDTVEVLAANGGVIGLSLSECNDVIIIYIYFFSNNIYYL